MYRSHSILKGALNKCANPPFIALEQESEEEQPHYIWKALLPPAPRKGNVPLLRFSLSFFRGEAFHAAERKGKNKRLGKRLSFCSRLQVKRPGSETCFSHMRKFDIRKYSL
jgi:hypothetical protein